MRPLPPFCPIALPTSTNTPYPIPDLSDINHLCTRSPLYLSLRTRRACHPLPLSLSPRLAAGLLVDPSVATKAFLCGYPRDGGTMGKVCHPPGVSDWCVPGCRMPYSVWSDPMRKDIHSVKQLLEEHKASMDRGERNGDRSCLQPNCFYNEVRSHPFPNALTKAHAHAHACTCTLSVACSDNRTRTRASA
eukprot:6175240-Pleurochrysis_carterae.AAC.2